MVQSYKSVWAKVCLNISGLHAKPFYNIKQSFSRCFRDPIRVTRIENRVPRIREDYHRAPRIKENRVPRIREIGSLQFHIGYLTFSLNKTRIKSNDFFLSWRRLVVLTAVTSANEVIVIFLQLILFATTAAFSYSLLGLVSHCFWEDDNGEEIRTRWRCVEKINHSLHSWLLSEAYKPAFHIYRAILESFFNAYSTIVDSFVIVSFFLRYIIFHTPQYYRWLTCYVRVRLCQYFGEDGCYFRCGKPCTCKYPCTQRFLILRSCGCLNSLGKYSFQT